MKLKDLTKITQETRDKVYKRDSFNGSACCIYCGRPYPEIHHYISRGRGGLGIEQNLVCLCAICHSDLHSTGNEAIKGFIQEYLMDHYADWDERSLTNRR